MFLHEDFLFSISFTQEFISISSKKYIKSMKTQPIQYADFVLCLFLRLRYNTFYIVMAISFTVNKQNIKYDKLVANTLHLMP